jgi:hypothetical protein
MINFNTTITDPAPKAYYIFNSIINLNSGHINPRQIASDKEMLFERIPLTNDSRITFTGADTRDGFINVYYIVLHNKKTYLFLHGNAPDIPLSRGGSFIELKDLDRIDYRTIERYLIENTPLWSSLYQARNWTELINAINRSFNDLQSLMV